MIVARIIVAWFVIMLINCGICMVVVPNDIFPALEI